MGKSLNHCQKIGVSVEGHKGKTETMKIIHINTECTGYNNEIHIYYLHNASCVYFFLRAKPKMHLEWPVCLKTTGVAWEGNF